MGKLNETKQEIIPNEKRNTQSSFCCLKKEEEKEKTRTRKREEANGHVIPVGEQ